jgi:hypothetical protein
LSVVLSFATVAFAPNAAEIVCSQCGRIALLRVVIHSFKPGFEERFLECSTCSHTETVFVELG